MTIDEINKEDRYLCYWELARYADKIGEYYDPVWDRKKLTKFSRQHNVIFDKEQKIVEAK